MLKQHCRRARLHSAAVHALIDPSCEPSPAVSRATSESAEVCCGQRRVRRTRDAGATQTNKSRSRPLSLASEWHEDGVRFPPAMRCCRRAVPRSRRMRACAGVLVCVRLCVGVHARLHSCCVGACVCEVLRGCSCVCAHARVSVPAGVCLCVHGTACVPPDASRARQPACEAHDRRCAASMAVGSNGRISARDMPRRAPVDGPSDAPVHASRRA
jgi:hypothetical protein